MSSRNSQGCIVTPLKICSALAHKVNCLRVEFPYKAGADSFPSHCPWVCWVEMHAFRSSASSTASLIYHFTCTDTLPQWKYPCLTVWAEVTVSITLVASFPTDSTLVPVRSLEPKTLAMVGFTLTEEGKKDFFLGVTRKFHFEFHILTRVLSAGWMAEKVIY